MINHQETFKTSDTALSAYLISSGIDILSIEHGNGSRSYFLFQQSTKLDKYVSLYYSGKAKGNILAFFDSYQNLLRRIKERY